MDGSFSAHQDNTHEVMQPRRDTPGPGARHTGVAETWRGRGCSGVMHFACGVGEALPGIFPARTSLPEAASSYDSHQERAGKMSRTGVVWSHYTQLTPRLVFYPGRRQHPRGHAPGTPALSQKWHGALSPGQFQAESGLLARAGPHMSCWVQAFVLRALLLV